MPKKSSTALLIGAPSTGKTSVLQELEQKGFICFEEISRQVTQEARDEGISICLKKSLCCLAKNFWMGEYVSI